MRRRITHWGIDTSHFVGSGHARGVVSPRRRTATEILVLRPPEAKRRSPTVLRRALEEAGRPYRCAECGIGGVWNDRPPPRSPRPRVAHRAEIVAFALDHPMLGTRKVAAAARTAHA